MGFKNGFYANNFQFLNFANPMFSFEEKAQKNINIGKTIRFDEIQQSTKYKSG